MLASAAAIATGTPGCQTHKCDPDVIDNGLPGAFGYPVEAGVDAVVGDELRSVEWAFVQHGEVVDGKTWESTPVDADWLPFGPERFWLFWLPDELYGYSPTQIIAYVSEEQHPVPTEIFAIASGNGAEMRYSNDPLNGHRIDIHNNTCQLYYVRVVATFARDPDAGDDASDAAAPLDAASDAVQDGPADAGTDAD
jgi:hypothetical protein